jgi:hypothetical protein
MDESLSTKIRFEKIYSQYLDCLKNFSELEIKKGAKPECVDVIRNYHRLLEKNGTFLQNWMVDDDDDKTSKR